MFLGVLSSTTLMTVAAPPSGLPSQSAEASKGFATDEQRDFDNAYETCDEIRRFDLMNRSDEATRAFDEFLKSNALRPVALWNANDEAARRVFEVPTIFSLELRGRDVATKSLKCIKNMAQLRELVLSGTSIEGEELNNLKTLVNLRHLKIVASPVQNGSFQFLARLSRLEQLTLAEVAFSDVGVGALANCQNLTTLYLGDTELTDSSVGHLAKMTHLKHLILVNNRITNQGEAKLRTQLRGTKIFGRSGISVDSRRTKEDDSR